jgi:phosphoglycerol transferase MdoB-like AlkP superfamily enzyme
MQPLRQFGMFAIISILFLLVSRICLMLWQADRVGEVDGWWQILGYGVRIDLVLISVLAGIPAVLTLLLSGIPFLNSMWNILCRSWLTLGLWLIVFMEVSTPSFIIEYDLRPNYLFAEYLIYPREVFSMLWSGHRAELIFAAVVSIATLYIGWLIFGRHSSAKGSQPRWYARPVGAIALLFLVLLAARSTLQHRPINPSYTAFSKDPLVNGLTLNSTYSMLYSVYSMKDEISSVSVYPKLSDDVVIAEIRKAMGIPNEQFTSELFPSLHRQSPSVQLARPKNLVIILEESLGARYVGSLGGMPLTPEFDKLAKQGWLFEQLYSTGTRSIRGIEAVITGFVPTPARSVVKLPKSQQNFFTIAQLLRENGYDTSFIYGGEGHFDNMSSFFLGNGFDRVIDERDYISPVFTATWGVSDEDLFNKAHQTFEQLHKQNKPFFSLVFSSSNHDPFEYPSGRIEPYDQPAYTVHNAIKYADYSIGKFIGMAKDSGYWKDTLFLIVADHDARVGGADLVPIDNFRIAGLILGDGVEPQSDKRIVSQIDLAPTLLSLMGLETEHPMIGFDLTRRPMDFTGRAIMQFDRNQAYMKGDQVIVLQPDKEPVQFRYDGVGKLSKDVLDKDLAREAIAHPLWGSMAYDKLLYRLTKPDN